MITTTALSIAGFDGSGGAGIQADIKTFSALGCYAMTALTALPIQNTTGVKHCHPIPVDVVEMQLKTLFDDIQPDCIKLGMLFSCDIITMVATFLREHAVSIPIVLDPVMVAKSGDRLLKQKAVHALIDELLPLSTVITPNLDECSELLGCELTNLSQLDIAKRIIQLGSGAALIKGGHSESSMATDILITSNGVITDFSVPKINTKNTHGTGCTLSAAIAAYLARGYKLEQACFAAKSYLTEALRDVEKLSVGQGCGPVNHFYHAWQHLPNIIESEYHVF